MDRFGPQWVRHADVIAEHWRSLVNDDDLVLVPGDISWAIKLEQALPDLEFLGSLPGQKLLLKGNHDYWWSSLSKVRRALPESLHAVQGDACQIGPWLLGGTRLWDDPDLQFGHIIAWQGDESAISAAQTLEDQEQSRRIFEREMGRLHKALEHLDRLAQQAPQAGRIVVTHYPPCGPALETSRATALFEEAGIHHVVFGHLHSLRTDLPSPLFGTLQGTTYHLASCDYIGFRPILIAEGPP